MKNATDYLGPLIRKVRSERKMTRVRLSQLTGLHVNTILRFESGEMVSIEGLVRIGDALGVEGWKILRSAMKHAQYVVQTGESIRISESDMT